MEALKAGWADGWAGGWADGWADVVPGAAVAMVGCGWAPGPDTARPGEQEATHSTVSAAMVTSGPRLLTIPGS